MILSELIPFLKTIDAKPKKGLSQNFLVDANIVRKIVQTADIKPGDIVLEIGPGPGALTKLLLEAGARVYAVEMDHLFAKELHRLQNGNLKVFEADFLEFPMSLLPPNIKIVANLPYHITTPIIEKVFAHPFQSLTIMVQKEVADRMSAKAGSKTFGSLSLFTQFYSDYKTSFLVPANCFYPVPKVDSTVIHLASRTLPDIEPTRFFPLMRKAFQQRRKMITSSLKTLKTEVQAALAHLNIRIDARPEQLSLDQWILLAKQLEQSPLNP